jgi:hypothetical protein
MSKNSIYAIIEQILNESTPKKIKEHPLYKQHINEIAFIHDKTFENLASKPNPQKLRKLLQNHAANEEKKDSGVWCKVCNNFCRDDIRQHLIFSHKMSVNQYKSLYEEEVISDKTKKIYSLSVTGDKNPAYNHRGRLSPFSKNFIHYKELTKNELEQHLSKMSEKRVQSTRLGKGFNNQLDFYLKQGYTEEESKELLKNRQATFSLKKCIEKYGEEKGRQKWEERHEC